MVKVDLENVDEEYLPLCSEEMSLDEIGQLGTIIVKHKLGKWKHKILDWLKHGKKR